MPLPKPPASKATLLSATDYETQAAARTAKRSLQPAARRRQGAAGADQRGGRRCRAAARSQARRCAKTRRAAAGAHVAAKRAARRGPPARQRLFVLDTNVLMHDPMCLFRFEEHDIFLPMITLEELDSHKQGMSEVARNARQASRELDALAVGQRR